MTRRSLLSTLSATLVLDPERALWVSGRKLVSIPSQRIVHAAWVGTSIIRGSLRQDLRNDYYAILHGHDDLAQCPGLQRSFEDFCCRKLNMRPSSVKFIYSNVPEPAHA